MAYRILYGTDILWEPYSDNTDAITDASMSVSVNAAKYLDFTMPPTHSLYNVIAERDKLIRLYANDKLIYKGYITKITLDMEGYKQVNCSSVMSYLGDTHVRDYSTIEGEQPLKAPTSLDGLFQWYIDQHNKHCMDSNKRFIVGVNQAGALDENNYVYRSSTQFPTTSSEIEEKILNLGGYIFERYEGDNNILDFYADAHEANTQILDFGVNITDFTHERSGEDQYTAIYATGYTPDPPEDDPEKKMRPISLADIQNGGSPYSPDLFKLDDVLYSISGVQRYGYREYYYSNDDITTTDYLLKAAGIVLTKLLAPTITLDVKAVDMALFMENGYEHLQLGQAVRVRSKPHNIDEYLMISGIDLDLQDPGQTSYTIGATYDTLTGQQSSYLKSLNSGINSSLDSVAALDKATKENAKGIDEAKKDAANATSKANEASNKADVATNTANSANTKANEANTKADSATETANSANTKANEANTKADAATETANSASQNAQKAQEGVAAAKDAASKAQAAADKAQADANANTKAVAQAQSAADAAKKAAADAQEKAENVESNLNSSNAVIEQHSNKLGELSTKVSNAVTNADAALTASTEAKQTATEASTTANTAYKDSQTAITNSTKATQTATEAKTTAESAVTTANDSLKQSSSAVQTANRIQNTLTTDYQTKADSDLLYATKSSLTETSESIKMEVSANYATKSTVESLKNVADNAIESWRGSGVPTSENKPASDWTTTEEKKRHSGDLYYDKDTGKAYRWGSDDGIVYSWVLNQDTDITKALQDASNAQKSADNAQTTANGAVTAAGNAQKSADGAQSTADRAKTAANNAQKTADTVQTDVDQLKIDIPNTYATKASLETTANSITAKVESVSTTANSAVTAASKAQQTADAINVNLTKNYQTKENSDNTYATKASLTATSESLSTSITKAQQTADGAVNASSKAQQTADAININLTKNYQTTKDADDKYATQTSLNATAESITSTVSNTYSQKQYPDTRNDNNNPDWYIEHYPRQSITEFKYCEVIGLSGDIYCTLLTEVPWNDSSGGYPKQTASILNKRYWRVGTSGSTWGEWKDVAGLADSAYANAKTAQEDVNALKNRVTTAETSIKQNSDAIVLRATKTDVTEAVNKNKSEIVSMGEQLVINGSGLMGDNTNFSSLIFDASKSNGSGGSFTRIGSTYVVVYSDNFLPVNPTIRYSFELDAMSSKEKAVMYSFLGFYDVDKKQITSGDHMYIPNTLTTLAKDLKNGDTVVYLTDMTNWLTSGDNGIYTRGFIFWNYKNSFGYTYPEHTYSRNNYYDLYIDSDINVIAKTITLKEPWTYGTFPAGTKVSQSNSGNTFKYQAMEYSIPPSIWKHYSGYYDGTDYSGMNVLNKFPPGTAYAKVGFLWNNNKSDDQVWVTNISVKTDYKHAIDEVATRVTNAETKIEQNSDAIKLRATKTEVTKDIDTAIQTSKTYTDTELTQTSEEIRFDFNKSITSSSSELQSRIDDNDIATNQKLSEINKYIRFVDGKIILGETGNELMLTIQNNRVSFTQSGVEVAYFSNNKLHINKAEVLTSMKIGNYELAPRTDGGLALRKWRQ